MKTACIFIDGENLRYSLNKLFYQEFDPRDYLPRDADWGGFFDDLVQRAKAQARMRSYWYVVGDLEVRPYGNWAKDAATRDRVLSKYQAYEEALNRISDPAQKEAHAKQVVTQLYNEERTIKKRFEGWKVFQDGIRARFDSVEFRRAGCIRYDLFQRRFGDEKAVDVNLAIDLLQLKDIYDVAIIVSGDQDYVPAVQAVKERGKHVVNVSFLERGGKLLPGGARRLNLATDRTIEMEYADVMKFMNFKQGPASTPASPGTTVTVAASGTGPSVIPVT